MFKSDSSRLWRTSKNWRNVIYKDLILEPKETISIFAFNLFWLVQLMILMFDINKKKKKFHYKKGSKKGSNNI